MSSAILAVEGFVKKMLLFACKFAEKMHSFDNKFAEKKRSLVVCGM